MPIKSMYSLVTPPTANEQANVHTITVTASGTSREYPEFEGFQRAILFLAVTAFTGAPTMAIKLQVEDPLTRTWHDVTGADWTVTGTAVQNPKTVELYGLNYRLAWTITGGTAPSVTFQAAAVVGAEEPIT